MAKVLIADDTLINRQFLTTLLGYGGHELLEACDGAEALDRVRAQRPDLVITDVLMPVMDGYEFVRRLRADSNVAATPVIFYTASYHEREALVLAESCGVACVLIKPAEPQNILAAVARTLNSSPEMQSPDPEAFDRDHLRLLTDKLSLQTNALAASNQRLGDLLQMGLMLATERDRDQLLTRFCFAIREMIGARFAFLGIFDDGGRFREPLLINGMDRRAVESIGSVDSTAGILADLKPSAGPVRNADVSSDPCCARLPPSYTGKRSFLGTRLGTSDGIYGVLWLLEKLGGEQFSEQEMNVLVTSVAQLNIAYENAQRYEEIRQHAARMEARVAERTAQLRDANEELEAFNYSVAHDLRSPLRHIRGYVRMLLERGADPDPEIRESATVIDESARKMGALLDVLLNLSLVGRQEMNRRQISPDSIVEEVVRELAEETQGRTIEWKIGPLPDLECDPVLIKQVFANLLSNAVKYSRPRATATIEVGTITEKQAPVIFVRDNGVGFDMKYADKLFGIFQRLHLQEEFEGTGAGLAIVQRIIRRHDGRVWAESGMGKGTTMFFTIGTNPSAADAA